MSVVDSPAIVGMALLTRTTTEPAEKPVTGVGPLQLKLKLVGAFALPCEPGSPPDLRGLE